MDTECVPWTGRINDQGYGTRGVHLAHRLVWTERYGEIPGGATIDHTCHDPNTCRLGRECPHRRCVNTAHMRLVSGSENAARGFRRASEVTHCPEGHEYAGDNLMICRGARYCRTCRRDQQAARRQTKRLNRCRDAGHEPDLRVDGGGREYCTICRLEHGQRTAAGRLRDRLGRVV